MDYTVNISVTLSNATHTHTPTYICMCVYVCVWNGQCQSIVVEIRQSGQQHMITAGIANIQFNRRPVDIFRINNAHSLIHTFSALRLAPALQRFIHTGPVRCAIKSSISLHFGQSPFMKLLMCASHPLPTANRQPPTFLV